MQGFVKVDVDELSRLAGLLDQTHTELLGNGGSRASGGQLGNDGVAGSLHDFYGNWDYRRKALAERLELLSTLLMQAADAYSENEQMLERGFAPTQGEGDSRNDPSMANKWKPAILRPDRWKPAPVQKAENYQALLPANPKPSDVAQGTVGDCYFAAAVASIAATAGGPALLHSMIKLREDNKFQVTFADGTNEVVDGDLYVDASRRLEGGGGGKSGEIQANWFSILEKAYAQRHMDGYETLDQGGNASDVFAELVPGGKCIDPLTVDRATSSATVWNRISPSFDSGHPVSVVVTGKTFPEFVPPNEGHELSVVGVHEEYGVKWVSLRNPWGELNASAGMKGTLAAALVARGAVIDSPTDDGTFRMKVEDLSRIISEVETGSAP